MWYHRSKDAASLFYELKCTVSLTKLVLTNNTKLNSLHLDNITERGFRAFLKLLVDVSSVESTYSSNHTLTTLILSNAETSMSRYIDSAAKLNKVHQSFHAAGRAKVINYQLSSNERNEVCCLQGVDYSAGSNFADIEPILLPRILALIGEEHGQSELYAALLPMVPDLMSCVDTSAMMKDLLVKNKARDNDLVVQIAELTGQRAALSTKNDQLSRRLTIRESGDRRQTTVAGSTAASGKKRQRS